MFDPSMAGLPPTAFQTYLTRSIPFNRSRRQSSSSTVNSYNSHARHASSASVSVAASPTTPLTPMSPDSFFGSRHNSSGSVSGSYDFNPSPHGSFDGVTPSTNTQFRRPSFLSGHASSISCSRCHADLALTSQIISKGFTGRHGRAYLVAPSTSALSSSPCIGSPGNLPNTNTHKQVPRHLVTGMHTVADISCAMCGSVLGWKYVAAEEEAQRYKVGKFILETRRCCVDVDWQRDGASLETGNEEAIGDDDGVFGTGDMDELFGVSSGNSDGRRRSSTQSGRSGYLHQRAVPGKGKTLSYHIDHSSGVDEEGDEEEQEEEIMFDSQDEDECEDLFAGIWSPELAKRRRMRRGVLGR